MKERIQKILARAGICSRRNAEQFIKEGKVAVDGCVITQMGCQADPLKQQITFDGKPAELPAKSIYLLLNKPKGYVTTMRDPQGRPVVTSLLTGIAERLFPVGRLDFNTEGALLMTNDGDLAQRTIHPRYEVNKTYVAKVKGSPSRKQLTHLKNGIEIDGQKTWPARLKVLESNLTLTTLEITIHEGKKRQIRKMFATIGHPVQSLKRIAYGQLTLGELPLGKYRFLNQTELEKIFI